MKGLGTEGQGSKGAGGSGSFGVGVSRSFVAVVTEARTLGDTENVQTLDLVSVSTKVAMAIVPAYKIGQQNKILM